MDKSTIFYSNETYCYLYMNTYISTEKTAGQKYRILPRCYMLLPYTSFTVFCDCCKRFVFGAISAPVCFIVCCEFCAVPPHSHPALPDGKVVYIFSRCSFHPCRTLLCFPPAPDFHLTAFLMRLYFLCVSS